MSTPTAIGIPNIIVKFPVSEGHPGCVQVLPSKGAVSISRGKVLLAHYKTPGSNLAAAAATAASNAAGVCQSWQALASHATIYPPSSSGWGELNWLI